MRNPPADATATDWMPRTSLPAAGSVSAYEPMRRPCACLLCLRAPAEKRQAVQASVHRQDHAEGRVHVLEGFTGDAKAEVVHAGAAVLFGDGHAQQAELGKLRQQAPVECVRAIQFADSGRDFASSPLGNCEFEQLVIV